MDANERAALIEKHYRSTWQTEYHGRPMPDVCGECGDDYPCDTMRLLDTLDGVQALCAALPADTTVIERGDLVRFLAAVRQTVGGTS